jgi:hypothetical protein
VQRLRPPFSSREHLYALLAAEGISREIALWLGSGLLSDPNGGFTWGFDVDGASSLYASFGETDFGDLVHASAPGSLHFVRGDRSDRWGPGSRDWHELQGKLFSTYTIPAGHWVATENPSALAAVMVQKISDPA